MGRAMHQKGFTIVELLIVVVVIAILAAITIVAYTGVAQRAKASAAQSAVTQAMKKLATYAVDNDAFPTTLDTLGISSSSGISFQYTVNNNTSPKGYCVTATAGGVSYYLSDNFTYTSSSTSTVNQPNPVSGACPGHSTTGVAITNLAPNPGVEVNTTGYLGPNGSSFARNTSTVHSGVGSVLVTMPAGVNGSNVGLTFVTTPDFSTIFEANTTYTVSAWVWVPSATTINIFMSVQGGARAALVDPVGRTATAKNQWVRIYNTFTTGTSGNLTLHVLNSATTPAGTTQFWVDDIMIVKGDTPANYADGNTAGWVWNGVAGNSNSSGPAI